MKHNRILEQNWKHDMYSPDEIIDKGFRYSHYYEGYVKRFPVYKHNHRYTTLECYIIIYKDEEDSSKLDSNVRIEVLGENGDFYAPFYNYNDGYKELIQSINKKIRKMLTALGITNKKVTRKV